MKIGVYSPYLDSFGGGERYILTIAEVLSKDHTVDLFYESHQQSLGIAGLKNTLEKRLNLDLSSVMLVKAPLGPDGNFSQRLLFFKKYDVLFYLTDGSVFYSTARASIIHFQVPFPNKSARSLWGKFKLSSWKEAVFNSYFTGDYVKKQWGVKGRVIYPPVDIGEIKPGPKHKYILSVGRFVSFTKAKKHEEMIKAFVQLYDLGKIPGWSLHLAGSVEGEENYLEELKKIAGSTPVYFYPDLSFEKLMELYGKAAIYWHAAGLGENDPVKMEHFGITTVEAMAAGCVPVVINKGGQKEIVENKVSGLLWDDLEQLKNLTIEMVTKPDLRAKLAEAATLRSKQFSKERFAENIRELVKKYG